MKFSVTCLVCLFYLKASTAVLLFEFYDFGREAGDEELPSTDDVATGEIVLKAPVTFFDKTYFSLFINSNGLISFLTEIPYFYNAQFPLDYPAIAPFYSDVDLTSEGGHVWYRQTSSPAMLERAQKDLLPHFSAAENFTPENLFIVTWESVGYYHAKSDKRNTFQTVIIADGRLTFVILNYADGGLQWLQGDGKTTGLKDAIAQAGFISEKKLLYTLRGSGTDQVRNLDKWSNVDRPGVWMFRVGKMSPGNMIQLPDLENGVKIEVGIEYDGGEIDSCATGGTICHSLATCADYEQGFCCQCGPDHYGNGINCVEKEAPIRVTGKVSGIINGMEFSDADLHSYVLSKEGRTYTAVSRITKDVGYDLQSLTSIGEGIAWLFALPKDKVKNGFILTGGLFNRTVEITFPHTGHKAFVHQIFGGLDVFNNVIVSTNVSGSIPTVPYRSEIVVDAFSEEFTRVEKGKLRSRSNRSFKLKEQSLSTPFNVETFIDFKECPYEPILPEHETLRLKIAENIFIRYDETESIVRYSFSSKIGTLEEEDPCIEGKEQCDQNSQCIVDGDSFRCVCKQGYEHVFDSLTNVAVCLDMNECDLGRNQCHRNALCINSLGSYSCQCKSGFTGTGFTCQSEFTCANAGCDSNAICEMIGGQPICTCRAGYEGSGFFCSPDFGHESCLQTEICSPFAICVQVGEEFQCVCIEGFTGDGYTCDGPSNYGDTNNSFGGDQLDLYPNLFPQEMSPDCVDGVCYCTNGYFYDSRRNKCLQQDPGVPLEIAITRPAPVCDAGVCTCPSGFEFNTFFLECDLVAPIGAPQPICYESNCVCPPGYELTLENLSCNLKSDDIHPIQPPLKNVGDSCDVLNRCHPDALCIYSSLTDSSKCICNAGHSGDGVICTPIQISCDQMQDACHSHAHCLYDEIQLTSVCECKIGYTGDGIICTPEDECSSLQDCDINAQCLFDVSSQRYRCKCNEGFEGNGSICQYFEQASCNIVNNCDRYAICVYDDYSLQYQCQCNEGFRGDGYFCRQAKPEDCNTLKNCGENAKCHYSYHDSGYKCKCITGYEGDGYFCRAIRSCYQDQSVCHPQATCEAVSNQDYICVCRSGYTGDGIYCQEAPDHEKNLLIINQGLSVLRLPIDVHEGKGFPIHVDPFMTAVGADVDCLEGRYYWTDVGSSSIRSSRYNGAEKRPIVSGGGTGSPEDVAVDWISKNIYWTDSINDIVSVANFKGDKMKTIIEGELVNPRGIAVHPGLGLIFWSDWNRDDPKIEAAGMDGTGRRKLVSGEGISLPNSLVVDYEAGMVCWADAGTNRIECVGITGYGRRVIVDKVKYPFGLTLHHRQFYYTDWQDSRIHQVNKYTGEEESTMEPPPGGSGKLYGIVAVPEVCPPVHNSCQNSGGNCPSTHICLPNGQGGRTCACPNNAEGDCVEY